MKTSGKNTKSDFEYISLFHTSVKAYNDVVNTLEKPTEENKVTQLKIKMMMLRKYISNGETVQLKEIAPKLQAVLPTKASEITEIYSEFKAKVSQPMIHVNSNGEEQDVREVFNDIAYGYFLHADFDKVERLKRTEEAFLWKMVEKFVKNIEDILLKFDEIIILELPDIEKNDFVLEHEPVIRYENFPHSKKIN